MTGTKIVVIVLVLVVVLFVVLVVWGAGNNQQSTFNSASYSGIGQLGSQLGFSSPKLKASELTPNPPPLRRAHPGAVGTAGEFILTDGDQPTTFNVAADSKDQFRQATFSITNNGCATIEYQTADHSGGSLSDQKWPKGAVDPKDPLSVTFQVLSAEGLLTIYFKGSNCTVQLR